VVFLVRIWAEEAEKPPVWRGTTGQTDAQQRCSFQTMEELVEWMRLELLQMALDQHNPFAEGGECEENYGFGTIE
jgi:hypothetical protein